MLLHAPNPFGEASIPRTRPHPGFSAEHAKNLTIRPALLTSPRDADEQATVDLLTYITLTLSEYHCARPSRYV